MINNRKKVLVEEGNKGYTECFSKVHFDQNISSGSIVEAKIISVNNNNLEGILS